MKYFMTEMWVPLLWQRLIEKYGPWSSHFRHAISTNCVNICFGFLCWPGTNYCLSWSPSLLSMSLCPCTLHYFEGPLLHLAQYFLSDISASCKNLIFLSSIPSSNLSKSPVLLLSSTALRMLPSLVPSAVLINLQFATSPRTLMRIFSNGSSKLILRLAWIMKSFLQLDPNSFCSE